MTSYIVKALSLLFLLGLGSCQFWPSYQEARVHLLDSESMYAVGQEILVESRALNYTEIDWSISGLSLSQCKNLQQCELIVTSPGDYEVQVVARQKVNPDSWKRWFTDYDSEDSTSKVLTIHPSKEFMANSE